MKLASLFAKPVLVALYLWILVGVGGYFLVDKLLMPVVAGQFKGTVQVPDLIGADPEKARADLMGRGLNLILDTTGDFSNDIPAGRILSQFPASTTTVKQGRRVWVKISKGLRRVTVPEIKGRSLRQAEITLQQMGLAVGKVTRVPDVSVPEGAVLGSHPRAGTALETGTPVEIRVSGGRTGSGAVVPDLVGMSLAQAKENLKNAGISVGAVQWIQRPRSLPQTVLEQNPRPGRPAKGIAVELVVSK